MIKCNQIVQYAQITLRNLYVCVCVQTGCRNIKKMRKQKAVLDENIVTIEWTNMVSKLLLLAFFSKNITSPVPKTRGSFISHPQPNILIIDPLLRDNDICR